MHHQGFDPEKYLLDLADYENAAEIEALVLTKSFHWARRLVDMVAELLASPATAHKDRFLGRFFITLHGSFTELLPYLHTWDEDEKYDALGVVGDDLRSYLKRKGRGLVVTIAEARNLLEPKHLSFLRYQRDSYSHLWTDRYHPRRSGKFTFGRLPVDHISYIDALYRDEGIAATINESTRIAALLNPGMDDISQAFTDLLLDDLVKILRGRFHVIRWARGMPV